MTQDIRELLELAAKACGHYVYGFYGDAEHAVRFADIGQGDVVEWAPHLNDGDGARMEAQLMIDAEWREFCAVSEKWGKTGRVSESYSDHNGNRQAARRMASLKVAAEIGRRVKG